MAAVVMITLAGVLGWSAPAGATWSIVASDDASGQVGAALASCLPADILGDPNRPLTPVVLVPGAAAAVAQAAVNLDAPPRIRELVAAGASPTEIVDDLASPSFDEVPEIRQYAAVRLDGGAAAITGSGTEPVALDRSGPGVSVQGNLLTSEQVVTRTYDRFEEVRRGGSDLATALVEGLAAGSEAGGDRRCGDQTALFAQVVVAEPGDPAAEPSYLLTVTVDEGDGQNPVPVLVEAHRSGRRGLIEAGLAPPGSGNVVRIVVLVLAAIALLAAVIVFRRGLGSMAARR
jgi:uncharacterized Ntn-hydrolase superfamily protein